MEYHADSTADKESLPSHVTGTSDNLVVIVESTTRQVSSVTRQLPADPHVPFPSFKTIDGANVIQPTAGHVTT